MSKFPGLIFIALIAVSCSTSKFTAAGDKEKKFVSDFISYMDKDKGPQYTQLMNCISPEYLKDSCTDKAGYKVDNIKNIFGQSIERYSKDGMVDVRIWGQDRIWVHILTFKLSKEKGKLYIVPSSHSNNYITPWWSRQNFVREK